MMTVKNRDEKKCEKAVTAVSLLYGNAFVAFLLP